MLPIFNKQNFAKSDIRNIFIIALIWIVMTILVNPLGDFPLNDDWAYGKAVKHLLEKGSLKISDWTPASQVAQILWGSLFCLPFGFSFTALRFSTLTLGLLGTLAVYGCLREVKAEPKLAIIGTAIVAVNPLYFQLSNTFMTDVPFMSFSILSIYLLLNGIRRESKILLVVGIVFTFLANLTRQFGIVIFISFGLAFLVKIGLNRQNIIKGLALLLSTIGSLVISQFWLQYTNNLPTEYSSQFGDLVNLISRGFFTIIRRLIMNAGFAFIYLGLFLLPFQIIIFPNWWKSIIYKQRIKLIITLITFIVIIVGLLILKGRLMPILINILLDFGLGPITLKDGEQYIPTAPRLFWIAITVISVISAGVLLLYVWYEIIKIFRDRPIEKSWIKIFVLLTCTFYFILIAYRGILFDRYLIFLMPLLLIIFGESQMNNTRLNGFKLKKSATSISLTLIVVCGIFTVGATHDYLKWNRVRWQALRELMQEVKVSPREIDGGFEFNGWYLYNRKYEISPNKSWWWVDKDNYVVSFGSINGYKEIKRYTFRRWMPPGEGSILVLQKKLP